MRVRHILVGTDFSDRSSAALRYAVGLARELSANLDLLHVVPPPARSELAINAYLERALPRVSEEILDEAAREMKRLLSTIPHEGVKVSTLVEAGDAAATIVRMATELPSDLIVMATHARTGLAELVLGSVAHRVLTCAPCPVLTLRGDEACTREAAR